MQSFHHQRTRVCAVLLAGVSLLSGTALQAQRTVTAANSEYFPSGPPQAKCSSGQVQGVYAAMYSCSGLSDGYAYTASASANGRIFNSSATVTGAGTALGTGDYSNAAFFLAEIPTFMGPSPSSIYIYYTLVLTTGMSGQGFVPQEYSNFGLTYSGAQVVQQTSNGVGAPAPGTFLFGNTTLDSTGTVYRARFTFLNGGTLNVGSGSSAKLFDTVNPAAVGSSTSTTSFALLGIEGLDANGVSLGGQSHCTFAATGESCDLLPNADVDEPVTTPEPATASLMLGGLLALGAFVRRKTRRLRAI